MKKVITWAIIVILVLGTIFAGGLFQFIDIIIVRPIVNILFEIYNLVGDFGLAIIIFTVLIKLCLWPLMKKQLKQTHLLNRLQPELVKIREKSHGNKQLESIETMELYKKHHVNPFSSLVVLCIQLPIFIALYSAIRVIAVPTQTDNLTNRAYDIVAYDGSIIKDLEEKQVAYLADLDNPDLSTEEKTAYDFHPQLFGIINLDARASDVFTGKFSYSALFMLFCAIAAAFIQYRIAASSIPKSTKKKTFRSLMKEAESGRELDASDVAAMSSKQTAIMMPIMMFFIMFSLHGALAFYYFLSNLINIFQNRIIRSRLEKELDDETDKGVMKELKNIKEAEIIENKKTGTKIKIKSAEKSSEPTRRKKTSENLKTRAKDSAAKSPEEVSADRSAKRSNSKQRRKS